VRPLASPPGITPAPDDAHPYRLPAAIDPATLRRYFTLHAADREEVGRCRGAATTLGFAVQLCTLRRRGHFLRDMAGVPATAVETAYSTHRGHVFHAIVGAHSTPSRAG